MPKERQSFERYSFPDHAKVVTPSNTLELDDWGVLFIGGTGDVTVKTAEGDIVTFANIPNGTRLNVIVRQVLVTGTNATGILVLY